MKKLSDLMYLTKTLDDDFCDKIIELFEKDIRKVEGITTTGKNIDLKQTTELYITNFEGEGEENWPKIDDILYKNLNENIVKYTTKLSEMSSIPLWNRQSQDSGYTIKRYEPGDYFHWHVDSQCKEGWVRTLAAIWYLNDVKEGGETEFQNGIKVKPKKGHLLLFPSTWTYPHRGCSPKNENKYVITTFLLTNEEWVYH